MNKWNKGTEIYNEELLDHPSVHVFIQQLFMEHVSVPGILLDVGEVIKNKIRTFYSLEEKTGAKQIISQIMDFIS